MHPVFLTETGRLIVTAHEGGLPEHPMHLFGYDAALLLFHAIEISGVQGSDGMLHIRRQALRDTLQAARDLAGITGPLTCTAFGDCSVGEFHIVRCDDPAARIEGLLKNVIYRATPEGDFDHAD